jgi:hypothetical protein
MLLTITLGMLSFPQRSCRHCGQPYDVRSMREHTANLLAAVPQHVLCIRTHPLPPCNSPAERHVEDDETATTIAMVMRRLSSESEAGHAQVTQTTSQTNLKAATPKKEGRKITKEHGLRLDFAAIDKTSWESVRSH